jgi:ribosomal protein S27E
MPRFLLGHLAGSLGSAGRYSHGDIRARRGFGFDHQTSVSAPPTEMVTFKCKTCDNRLKFNASTWLYSCVSCGSTFNRGDFNKKAGYLTDPFCHTTRHNYESQKRKEENPGALHAVQLKCENCTAVLINDGATNTYKCKFCGSIYMKT